MPFTNGPADSEALNRLTSLFYDKVLQDPPLEPVFRSMSADHLEHVAAFIGEVFGGPKLYSEKFGGHPSMIQHHLNRHLTEDQRKRWIALLLDAADEVSLPDDPEFRSAFAAYLHHRRMGHAARAAELPGWANAARRTPCHNGTRAFLADLIAPAEGIDCRKSGEGLETLHSL